MGAEVREVGQEDGWIREVLKVLNLDCVRRKLWRAWQSGMHTIYIF